MLTEKQIESFQAIYKQTYGQEISHKESERLASSLILFMESIIKP